MPVETTSFTYIGSTRGITNSSQSATDSLLYDAFGMTINRTGTTPTPFGFVANQQYQTDVDSGLMLLGHRYYDASIGRFLSIDPIHDGDNWYAYCDNNPINRADPTGLWIETALDIVGLVADVVDFIDKPSVGGGLTIAADVIGVALPGVPSIGAIGLIGKGIGKLDDISDMGRGIGKIDDVVPPSNCFVAGTLVTMADGSSKPIEKVKTGDYVLSRDQYDHPEAGEKQTDHLQSKKTERVTAKKVVQTFVTKDRPILKVNFANGEEVETTEGHPFYVEGKGWTFAGDLAIGNAIVTRAGPSIKITNVQLTGKQATVYNFEVETTHTYFVGKANGGAWVHNTSGFEKPTYTPKSEKHVIEAGHTPEAPISDKSVFNPGVGGQSFTDRVVNHPKVKFEEQDWGTNKYTVESFGDGFSAGTNEYGYPATGGEVIVQGVPDPYWRVNEVVSQYPW